MSYIGRKLKFIIVAFMAIFMAFSFSGCGSSIDDYTGVWMGLDERGGAKAKLYQYEIDLSNDGVSYTIKVTQFDYDISATGQQAQWRASTPHLFSGYKDGSGNLVTEIGVIRSEPNNFRLVYGNINLVRKAKNTEVKLKYVLRSNVEATYPGIAIAD